MKRIIHVVAGLTLRGGGLAEQVLGVAIAQRRHGDAVTVVTLTHTEVWHKLVSLARQQSVDVVAFPSSVPHFIYFSWRFLFQLHRLIRLSDVVHIHSNWTFPVWWSGVLSLWYRKKYVMSPHGCYDPVRMRHSAWKKKCVGWMDRLLARRADVIHVTSEVERGWVENFLNENKDNRQTVRICPNIVLVPNGVETPASNKWQAVNKGHDSSQCTRTVLYMGRLHPLKGLDLLLKAWAEVKRSAKVLKCESTKVGAEATVDGQAARNFRTLELSNFRTSSWQLLIVGPDEQGTKNALLKQIEALSIENHVVFMGLMQGDEKWDVLRQADVFVLPSRSENFGIVVGEALACGIPVVMTDVGPWKKMAEAHTWRGRLPFAFVETTPPAIADGLLQMMALDDDERKRCGLEGKTWVAEQFGWKTVAEKMLAVYENILEEKH